MLKGVLFHMENKVVCYYCGTIYNEEEEKCPLCGGKVRTAAAQSPQPVRRERITPQQRKERQRTAAGKGKYANRRETERKAQKKSNDNTRTILIAALIFLALAVVVVTWFIGDMIGWWGGLEDSVDRKATTDSAETSGEVTDLKDTDTEPDSQDTTAESDSQDTTAEPEPTETETIPDDFEPELNFSSDVSLYQRSETVPLRVNNLPVGAVATWTSSDETVAKVDENGVVTAVSGGSATVVVTVGGKTAEVLIRCPFDESGDIGAHLYYTDVTISVGESYNLYLLDINGNRITDVEYTVSKEGICTIDDGRVTGASSGTTVVTVTYNTVEYECIVRVK